MDAFLEFVRSTANTNQAVVLFLVIALGVLLGKVEVKGCSLGSSGVLFAAILFGHLGATLPPFISTVGVVLFVYAIGLQAGPRFFKTFRSHGLNYALMAIATLVSGFLVTLAVVPLFGIDGAIAAGLFTGSMTTTPGLAAAMEAIQDPTGEWGRGVSVGYGIAYPFGVAGVVLFVQVFPRLMRLNLRGIAAEEAVAAKSNSPAGNWFEVRNPQLAGMSMGDFLEQHLAEATITRVQRSSGEMLVANSQAVLQVGDRLWIVALASAEKLLTTVVGPRVSGESPLAQRGADKILVRDAFVSEAAVAGRTLADLRVRETYGVVVSRLWREEIEFLPRGSTSLEVGDTIRVVGSPEDVERFIAVVGNMEKKIQETNFLPLCAGLVLGCLLGMQPFTLPGTDFTFRLGLAGGPLFVALIAGHYGRLGTMRIRMPVAAKMFIRELGLLFFLAGAGVQAGASFWTVLRGQGLPLFIGGVLITIVPMVVAWVMARRVFRLGVLPSLGAICGGMTSTPALGALSSACDSDTPSLAYATVYPVALIVVTMLSQVLAKILFAMG